MQTHAHHLLVWPSNLMGWLCQYHSNFFAMLGSSHLATMSHHAASRDWQIPSPCHAWLYALPYSAAFTLTTTASNHAAACDWLIPFLHMPFPPSHKWPTQHYHTQEVITHTYTYTHVLHNYVHNTLASTHLTNISVTQMYNK